VICISLDVRVKRVSNCENGAEEATLATKRHKPVRQAKSDTASLLRRAAAREFRLHGYFGTDTNKIARRAGFAPQTFYRWFDDKLEVFLAVYALWVEEEFAGAEQLLAAGAPNKVLIESVIAHHRAYRLFRRSLRQLSLEEPRVRKARAASRLAQTRRIRSWLGNQAPDDAEIAVFLLQHERLCDAIADGEFADLGFDETVIRRRLGALYDALRTIGA
jgi:AcrR family transcriptional regulator